MNRSLERELIACLSGNNTCGTLMQATKEEIHDIIIQLKSKRDSLVEIENLKKRVAAIESKNGIEPPKTVTKEHLPNIAPPVSKFFGFCGKPTSNGSLYCGFCGRKI